MDFLQIVWEPSSDGIRLFGDFKIHYYSLMWMLAFVLGYQIMKKIYKNEEQSEKKTGEFIYVLRFGHYDRCATRPCYFLPIRTV